MSRIDQETILLDQLPRFQTFLLKLLTFMVCVSHIVVGHGNQSRFLLQNFWWVILSQIFRVIPYQLSQNLVYGVIQYLLKVFLKFFHILRSVFEKHIIQLAPDLLLLLIYLKFIIFLKIVDVTVYRFVDLEWSESIKLVKFVVFLLMGSVIIVRCRTGIIR